MANETVRDAATAKRKKPAARKGADFYKGVLATPIQRDRISLLYDREAETERIARERTAKLPALAEAFGLTFEFSLDSMFELLMALACREVPGFHKTAPPGRRKEWSELETAYLRRDIEAVMAATGKTLRPAIKEVMQSAEWRDRLADRTVGAVEQQYKKGAPWLQILTDAEAMEKMADNNQ